MATASQSFNKFFAGLLTGAYGDLSSVLLKVILVDNTLDMTTATTGGADAYDFYSDIVTDTCELTTTGGYTVGGATLATVTVTQDDTQDRGTLDAADLTWAAATLTARGCILFYDTTVAATSPLMVYHDFGADKTVTGTDFIIQWHADGILYIG